MSKSEELYTPVPTQWVGPMLLSGNIASGEVSVPLATYETPLWPSTGRGARVSRACDQGIRCTLIDERMSRSIAVRSKDAHSVSKVWELLSTRFKEIKSVAENTSRFAKLIAMNKQIVGNLLYIRLEYETGDASGHNMVTKASDAILSWVLEEYPDVEYSSISGNFCTDKKVSAVNGILGRGKNVIAEINIPRDICKKMLRTTPEKIVQLNIEKNLVGGIAAGSLRSANAHFANMLLAFYLATGQDAANIIEGSQGIVHCEVRDDFLYFSVTLPNLILGTIGNGKGSHAIEENLRQMDCIEDKEIGNNSRRLAALCAATVLCGELSLMAAQTNPGELMRSHIMMERQS
ncbi:MAG: hydroxymethylglutaryl-CoA reductase [Pseudomonadota bacterium]